MAKATMSQKAVPTSVPTGEVTFQVTNACKSAVHEMILSPAPDTSKLMPFNADESRVDEEKAEHLGEV